MMNIQIPYLCGGTFFSLLIRAKRSGRTKKDLQKYGSDGYTNTALMKALIMLFDPNYYEPTGTSLDTNTSRYKACEISDADCLPFHDSALIDSFDNKIQSHYAAVLAEMEELSETFLTIEKEAKIRELTYSVLNLIKDDESVLVTDMLYAQPNGQPISKQKFLSLEEVNLPALLLGVWHYILMYRKDNTLGKPTIDSWHEKPECKGDRHTFISDIGKVYSRNIKISTDCEIADDASNVLDDVDDIKSEPVEVEAEVVQDFAPSLIPKITQNIQNQFNITQTGNGTNVGYAEKVEIRDGKVVTLK